LGEKGERSREGYGCVQAEYEQMGTYAGSIEICPFLESTTDLLTAVGKVLAITLVAAHRFVAE